LRQPSGGCAKNIAVIAAAAQPPARRTGGRLPTPCDGVRGGAGNVRPAVARGRFCVGETVCWLVGAGASRDQRRLVKAAAPLGGSLAAFSGLQRSALAHALSTFDPDWKRMVLTDDREAYTLISPILALFSHAMVPRR
jgi:hypothetical protein